MFGVSMSGLQDRHHMLAEHQRVVCIDTVAHPARTHLRAAADLHGASPSNNATSLGWSVSLARPCWQDTCFICEVGELGLHNRPTRRPSVRVLFPISDRGRPAERQLAVAFARSFLALRDWLWRIHTAASSRRSVEIVLDAAVGRIASMDLRTSGSARQ